MIPLVYHSHKTHACDVLSFVIDFLFQQSVFTQLDSHSLISLSNTAEVWFTYFDVMIPLVYHSHKTHACDVLSFVIDFLFQQSVFTQLDSHSFPEVPLISLSSTTEVWFTYVGVMIPLVYHSHKTHACDVLSFVIDFLFSLPPPPPPPPYPHSRVLE